MDKPNIGDVRTCTSCGEEKARYSRVGEHEKDADTQGLRRGEQPGDQYAWACDACGFEDRVPP